MAPIPAPSFSAFAFLAAIMGFVAVRRSPRSAPGSLLRVLGVPRAQSRQLPTGPAYGRGGRLDQTALWPHESMVQNIQSRTPSFPTLSLICVSLPSGRSQEAVQGDGRRLPPPVVPALLTSGVLANWSQGEILGRTPCERKPANGPQAIDSSFNPSSPAGPVFASPCPRKVISASFGSSFRLCPALPGLSGHGGNPPATGTNRS